jgi:hypothetical protein
MGRFRDALIRAIDKEAVRRRMSREQYVRWLEREIGQAQEEDAPGAEEEELMCAKVTLLEEQFQYRAKATLLEDNVGDVLDTRAQTRARFEKGPFSTSPIGRELLKRVIPTLADNIRAAIEGGSDTAPPRGLEQVLRLKTPEELAFMAFRTLVNQAYDERGLGPDREAKKRKKKRKNPPKNPEMALRLELGRLLRDEVEFAGLFAAKNWVTARGRRSTKHAALATAKKWKKFREPEWTNKECAQAGDWLIEVSDLQDLFVIDERSVKIVDELRAAIDELAEELVFRHPLYMPSLSEPAPWTGWRTEYDDKINATFIKTNHPEAVEAVKAAFANGSIEEHARGVSAIQRVPLKINPVTLPLLKEFDGEEYRRDVAVADALLGKTFWNLIRCDFRGRLVHLCDFNYTRGGPVRSLFMFAQGKKVGDSIGWLEIAVANAFGVKGTWRERHEWVAGNRERIKAAATSPRLQWLQTGKPDAKEPFAFAAACAEYVAADTHGPEYETHLPIWLDASSNGLQHFAMMGRDERLAEMVNLNTRTDGTVEVFATADGEISKMLAYAMDVDFAGEVPPAVRNWRRQKEDKTEDVYEIVAERALTNLLADHDDPLTQFWLDHKKHLRDLLKQPIMTLPYGATKRGMLEQIEEKAKELGLTLPNGAAAKLRDHVWRAIEQKLPGAMRLRECIQGIARHCLDRKTFMSWASPTGVPISNRYRKSKHTRVRLPFLGQVVIIADEYTNEPMREKVINSAVANVTHSMDASHLVLSVNAAAAEGIQALTIHDCFGALAADAMRFAQMRRAELARMYYGYDPLTRLRDGNIPPGTNDLPLPSFGNLDVIAVTWSEYFDR